MDNLYTVQEVGNTAIAYNATADLFEMYVDNQCKAAFENLHDAQDWAFAEVQVPRFDW